MKLYLSGCHHHYKYLTDFNSSKLGYLVSYYYLRDEKPNKGMWKLIDYCQSNNVSLMLDSGAYSAMKKRENLNNNDYIDFCKEHKDLFNVIVSLDVIGNYKKTRSNYDQMKNNGINGLITFHIGSPFDELKRIIKQEQYIGIGGIAGKGNQKTTSNWLKYIYSIMPDNIHLHGFGVTTPKFLHYSWHSIDGTTPVTAAIIYGRIMINLGNGQIKWVHIRNEQQRDEVWHLIKETFKNAWDVENNKSLPNYPAISLCYNVKTLLDVIEYKQSIKQPIIQEFLL